MKPLYWKAVDAVDEWAHRRHLVGFAGFPGDHMWSPDAWYLAPFRWLCEHRERRLRTGWAKPVGFNIYVNDALVGTAPAVGHAAEPGPVTWTSAQDQNVGTTVANNVIGPITWTWDQKESQ